METIDSHSKKISLAFQSLFIQFENPNGDAIEGNMNDSIWVEETKEVARTIHKLSLEPGYYQVPSDYQDSHDEYLTRMELYNNTMNEIIISLDEKNMNLLDDALLKLE